MGLCLHLAFTTRITGVRMLNLSDMTLNLIKPVIAHVPKSSSEAGHQSFSAPRAPRCSGDFLSSMGQRPEIVKPIVNVRVVSLKCMLASTSVPCLVRLQHEAAMS